MNTMVHRREVVFIAAENGALPGGKVGGVGDIVRDLPPAVAREAWGVTTLTPSYGVLHRSGEGVREASLSVEFGGESRSVDVWAQRVDDGVKTLVFDAPEFSVDGSGAIYQTDEADNPFASDATRFAFFCACAAAWLRDRTPDVVHLHDWHAAFYCLLREFDPRFAALRRVPAVFTIHNLAYQGIRPLDGHDSSLAAWYPHLTPRPHDVADRRYPDCINPMATAIRLADRLSTVSPSYANEICRASEPDAGFIGGEGLETLLAARRNRGELTGILNGCNYDDEATDPGWTGLLSGLREQVDVWSSGAPSNAAHALAAERLSSMSADRPDALLVSIGRLVAQKMSLCLTAVDGKRPALAQIARDHPDCLMIILGSGEAIYEAAILEIARTHNNVLFLNGYSETLADPLYAAGDLFLMPSSFEPCGISQMLAMRAGQPCVVHGVGGLRDTVEDGRTGFVFEGVDQAEQARNFVATVRRATGLRRERPGEWRRIREAAQALRFEWSTAARATIEDLYGAALA